MAKEKTPEELKTDLDAKMQRAEQHREQLLKTTQESAASEVAKAKHIAQEHEGKAAETSEAPTPTKGREIPRD